MLPRRFYSLSVFCAFALVTIFFFLNRNIVSVSAPIAVPNSWTDSVEQTWEQVWNKSSSEKTKEEGSTGNTGFVQGDTSSAAVAQGALHTPSIASSQSLPRPTLFPPPDTPLPDLLRVAVVESGGTNEETTAALIHAFGVQSHTQLSLYLLKQRYGIGGIINNFNLTHAIAVNKSSTDFAEAIGTNVTPQIVVSATCESDLIALDAPFRMLLNRKSTYLFCIVHQPARWSEKDLTSKIKPWIDQQMVDLVTLSQHTAHHLRTNIVNNWDFNATVTVRHIAPLFPVQLPTIDKFPTSRAAPKKGDESPMQYPIAIHGDFDASRHNYTDAFSKILALKDRAKSLTIQTQNYTREEKRDVSLHILGERLPPNVPKKVKPILSIDREMSFQRQYEVLSQSYILLPAFASSQGFKSDYLTKLASWSVPASLIAGVPIAGDEEILEAYNYLPRDTVWFRYPGENEMKVAERVVLWSEEEHRRKKESVRRKCQELITRNVDLVDEWIHVAMRRVERAGWRMATGSVTDFYAAIAMEDDD